MNIQFILSAKSFLEAAEIEEILQNKGVQYSIDGKLNGRRKAKHTKPAKRKSRMYVTKKIVSDVIKFRKSHTVERTIANFNLSRSTVNRIIKGTHTLQLKK